MGRLEGKSEVEGVSSILEFMGVYFLIVEFN
jgi:hypothetical protein